MRGLVMMVGVGTVLGCVAGCSRPNPNFDPLLASGGGTGASTGGTESSGSATLDGSGGGGGSSVGDGQTTLPPPGDTTEGASESSGEPGEPPTILYINFDGVELWGGSDDAALDQSPAVNNFDGVPPIELAPYDQDSKRGDILIRLSELWEPFNVAITTDRPNSGDYAMVIVTSTPSNLAGVIGFADQDCGDANPRSVGFAISNIEDGMSADEVANVISHSAGRGYGLENTNEEDLMSQYLDPDAEFVDLCLPTMVMPPLCPGHFGCQPGFQNSFAELEELFPF